MISPQYVIEYQVNVPYEMCHHIGLNQEKDQLHWATEEQTRKIYANEDVSLVKSTYEIICR